ncbi:hypothetical protein BC937DRAFT_88747 [Endogone sp. FLAS-F59071]|nr:hypothetical protein BC937DRAFT_88747 [Endogone sp. FLAS-F59071]|eukprot:RUS22487.1 hypothetical protein BC937DRAFT_88747 [Endogone sp. FLAS-F59071]
MMMNMVKHSHLPRIETMTVRVYGTRVQKMKSCQHNQWTTTIDTFVLMPDLFTPHLAHQYFGLIPDSGRARSIFARVQGAPVPGRSVFTRNSSPRTLLEIPTCWTSIHDIFLGASPKFPTPLPLQSQDQSDTHFDYLILESPRPTTLVDLTRLSVEQTDLLPGYARTRAEFYRFMVAQMEDQTYVPGSQGSKTGSMDADTDDYLWTASSPGGDFIGWSRPVFQPVKHAAPMVHTLLTDLFRLPSGMREAYVRQWRRWLVRKGLELIRVLEDETNAPLLSPSLLSALNHHSTNSTAPSTRRSSISSFVNLWRSEEVPAAPVTVVSSPPLKYLLHILGLANEHDFEIVLAQAEKLQPGMVEFARVYLGVG